MTDTGGGDGGSNARTEVRDRRGIERLSHLRKVKWQGRCSPLAHDLGCTGAEGTMGSG